MIGLDAQFKVLAAVVGVAFAVVVLAAGRRRPAHVALSAFFLLIALNQGAEAARAVGLAWLSPTGWQRVAATAAALDPLALLAFAALHPHRDHRLDQALPVALGVAAGLALWAGWAYVDPYPPVDRPLYQFAFPSALALFTVVAYGAFLVRAAAALEADGSPSSKLLLLSAGVAFFRPMGYLVQELFRFSLLARGQLLFDDVVAYAFVLLDIAAIVVVFLLLAKRSPVGRGALLVGAGLAILLDLVQLVEALSRGGGVFLAIRPFGQASAAIRFLLFGTFVSMAIVRHDALGASLRQRRAAARVLIVLAVVVLGALALAPFAGTVVPPWALVALGAAVVLSQGFQRGIDRIAWSLFAVPPPRDEPARVEAYRAALRQAAAEGRPHDDAGLARLRADLDLDPSVAAVLADAAERERGPIRVGDVVASRYRVARPLGSGTGGRVFLATDERLGRDVVLKEIAAGAGQATELAMREARAAGEAAHPNVVTVFDVLPRARTLVLVTEHVAGGSLADRFALRGPLAGDEATALAEGVLRGLAAIHARGVVHRDIKPANILLGADGTPKIADFGLARLGGEDATHGSGSWTGPGTPAYMAPEQRRGAPATARSDVFAVGLVLRHALREPLPPALAAAIERALAEEPSARWADAGEMLAALRAQRAQ